MIFFKYPSGTDDVRGRVQQGVLEIRRWINRAAITKVKRSEGYVGRKVGSPSREPSFSIGDAITEDFRSIDREKWSITRNVFLPDDSFDHVKIALPSYFRFIEVVSLFSDRYYLTDR